jgi:hypothetical protein
MPVFPLLFFFFRLTVLKSRGVQIEPYIGLIVSNTLHDGKDARSLLRIFL